MYGARFLGTVEWSTPSALRKKGTSEESKVGHVNNELNRDRKILYLYDPWNNNLLQKY